MRYRGVLLAAAAACCVSVSAMAGTVNIDVGYADTLRPAGFFPNPWVGAPHTVTDDIFGCASSGDCGAIGIDNRTGSTTLHVVLGQTSINFTNLGNLDGTLTVAPGQFGIFVLDDSSDLSHIPGAGPGNPAVGCNGTSGTDPNPAETCPMFALSLDGGATFTTFKDSGHVLDSNGWDEGGANLTEAFQWRPVGTSGTHSGTPEPLTVSLLAAGLLGGLGLRRKR